MSVFSQNVSVKRPKDEGNDGGPIDNSTPITQKRIKKPNTNEKGFKKFLKEEKEMKRLENFLFGSLYSVPEFGKETDGEAIDMVDHAAPPSFSLVESTGNGVVYDLNVESEFNDDGLKQEKEPAWLDDEEEMFDIDIAGVNRLRKLRKEADENVISGVDYVARLRSQHAKLNPGTDWARIDYKSVNPRDSDIESDDGSEITVLHGYKDSMTDDILRSNVEHVVRGGVKLLPGLLEYSRLMNANSQEPSNAPINSVEFHRNGQLFLAGGLDRRLRFFQVDGKRNPIIQSVFIEDCPIHKASFLPDGSQVILAGRRKFFYNFDLVKAAMDKIGPLTGREERSLERFEVSPDSGTVAFIGNEGYILLVSTKTKELIGTLKMNGSARSLAFVDGGKQLMSSGGDGFVYHWDLRTRRCIHKAVDEGCITSTSLCASPESTLFAAGSSSGIVNIYDRVKFLGGRTKPLKAIENLTTSVDKLKFNHDGQLLAATSNMMKNGLKLIHIPSFNVFSNFPPPRFSLQYPRCFDFSPNGGFMAVGNAAGKVLLYKLNHYQNA